ncbi:DHH family phosphoesterase [bacterium]|nr:DHH family phosphoesterase [bacterium]
MPKLHDICTKLDSILKDQKYLLIVLHDNPDPDTIASGWAFQFLIQNRYGVECKLVYGGLIGRTENHAMVRELKIPLKKIGRIRFSAYDRIALVDTQPNSGNHSLPDDLYCHIVFDHHPQRRGTKSDFMVIDPEVGATVTLVYECLQELGMDIPVDLATAIAYGIRSETQDLGREASKRDIDAYLAVYSKTNIRKLAKITHPKLPRFSFMFLYRALEQAQIYRHLVCTQLGDIPNPDIVGEIADMMLRMRGIGWSLCTGRYHRNLILSLRSSNPKAKAGVFIKNLVHNKRYGGGHDLSAGGKIKLCSHSAEELNEIQNNLLQDFAGLFGYRNVEWKKLIQ